MLEQRVAARTAALQAALAELQRAGKARDEFMAMISHELRTPLMGVLSLAELLEDTISGPLTGRQATYVQGIRHSGERLLGVINGILAYTHLVGGKVQLEIAPCPLAYLLGLCAAAYRSRIDARRQVLVITVDPPRPPEPSPSPSDLGRNHHAAHPLRHQPQCLRLHDSLAPALYPKLAVPEFTVCLPHRLRRNPELVTQSPCSSAARKAAPAHPSRDR